VLFRSATVSNSVNKKENLKFQNNRMGIKKIASLVKNLGLGFLSSLVHPSKIRITINSQCYF